MIISLRSIMMLQSTSTYEEKLEKNINKKWIILKEMMFMRDKNFSRKINCKTKC